MLIKFLKIKQSDSRMIYKWRTSARVENYMETRFRISSKHQKKWIKQQNDRNDFMHWMISFNNKKIGYLIIYNFKNHQNSISWGFYIGNKKYLFISGIISISLHNYLFLKTNIKKINGIVLSHNINVLKARLSQGYKIIQKSKKKIFIEPIKKFVYKNKISISKKIWIKENKKTLKIIPKVQLYKSIKI